MYAVVQYESMLKRASSHTIQLSLSLKSQRGTLSLRKPVPAILAFITHFRLKQLELRNDQGHVDRLATVLYYLK